VRQATQVLCKRANLRLQFLQFGEQFFLGWSWRGRGWRSRGRRRKRLAVIGVANLNRVRARNPALLSSIGLISQNHIHHHTVFNDCVAHCVSFTKM